MVEEVTVRRLCGLVVSFMLLLYGFVAMRVRRMEKRWGGMAWTYVQLGGIGVGAVMDAIVAMFSCGVYPCWWRSWRIGVRALGITYLE